LLERDQDMIRLTKTQIVTVALAALSVATPAWAQGAGSNAGDPLLRVTQMNAENQPIGVPQQTSCPANGCQLASLLLIDGATTSLQTVVTFAGQGIYVVLESPGTGAQIHLYGDPRPAPLFLPKTTGNLSRTVHIAIDLPSTGRQAQARQLTALDTYLRIEINQAPAGQPQQRQAG
jgi:hypothetical protein